MPAARSRRPVVAVLRVGLLVTLAAVPAAAQVVINEVVSANQAGLLEPDGGRPDWIELYNPSAGTVDLTGWGLSDDPDDPLRWRLPPIAIAPGGHVVVLAAGEDRRATRWQTVVAAGDTWRYRGGETAPPSGWMVPGFDDSGWNVGPSGFGFGDGDDATEIASRTVYLRRTFQVDDPASVAAVLLQVDYDDAFVAYLNGVEVARSNIGVDNIPPYYLTRARSEHEARMYAGGDPESWLPDPALLVAGTNLLALQVHDVADEPEDLSAIPFLTLGFAGPVGLADDVPAAIAHLLPRPGASFELNSSGETLVLADPSGLVVDTLEVPRLYFDDAVGRSPDGAATLRLFDVPTPGSANPAGADGYAARPAFSLPAGLYPSAVDVEVTSPTGTVHYTLDGSEPTQEDAVASSPIRLTGTAVLRARVFESGRLPSPTRTRSYLIDEAATTPVVSLVTDPDHFFDEETGIYVLGPDYDPDFPYHGANFWQDWERPVHVEIFDASGARELDEDAGVKIHGNVSRALPQRTLRLIARGGYGTSSFDGRLFPDTDDNEHDTLLLRNAGNDWCSAQLRDGIISRSVIGLDVDRLAFRPAVMFLNGEYWGLHNLRQRADEATMAEKHGLDRDEIDFLELQGKIMEGSNLHYLALLDYIEDHGLVSDADLAHVRTRMDVDEYATYAILHIYHADTDWLASNVKYWRPQSDEGRWRWILYDLDFGLGLLSDDEYDTYTHDTLAWATDPDGTAWSNPAWSTFLLRNLLDNESFRRDFVNRYADLLNTVLEPGRLQAVVDEVRALVEPAMPRHVARWDCSMPYWRSQMDGVAEFVRERPAHARQHVVDHFGLAGTYRLGLDVQPAGAGDVDLNTISVDGPFSGTYFLGNPITLRARARAGWTFAGWTGGSGSGAPSITLNPGGDATLVAHFAPASSPVVINEINYNSPPDFDPEDWVELHNAGAAPVDLSGWTMTDDDPTHVLVLPQDTVLAAGGYLVLARDPAAFSAAFPTVTNVVPAGFGFALDNGGDEVRLYDAGGVGQDGVAYDDDPPWPSAADGDGATLALASPRLDNSEAGAWFASGGNGTPGAANRTAAGPSPRPGPRLERGPTAVVPR